ncbi:hypothetical protein [thiotrophic endosymbiont of Bathymodiolus puteoserpentis (Logatchev)]|uniref:hypothetical protein n=1 Tax=thiotrophic endosymbiont of Bathymodiolus puteoserpentis (Logatchev) TaxID=343240 RepID=UPI0010B765E1|nr:hypothetical protein [thiotrophic endosymbiont of Bathymodiolus puteoserpentis (Logatchev)]SSC10346.1 hypothetical protein BPUTEOSOX_118 [thiotrophic endosymbiont of Bathymodiolus puteoserpentis (Logatchev)]
MKKNTNLSLQARNRLIRRNRNGKNRKKSLKKEQKQKKSKSNNPCNQNSKKILRKIDLPKNFDLHKNTDTTLEVMYQFRKIVDKDDPRLQKLNFDDITQINPSSALMLVAELDVWSIKSSNCLSSNHKTWHADIKSLYEMGLFELLKLPPLENNSPTNDTTFLKFISGKNSEGEKAKQLRENIERVIGKSLEQKLHLFDGLTEAFTNTTQHAYDKDNSKEFDKWWITASYKQEDKKLIVSMYDRGNSIPTTMHTNKKWFWLDERKNTKHSELIRIAMETSFKNKNTRTKTKEPNRGKGLKQLLDFIKNQGQLTIISNKGYCSFQVENEKLTTTQQKELKYPLQGTLIEWQINV